MENTESLLAPWCKCLLVISYREIPCCQDRKVYRGMSGFKLPPCFFIASVLGSKGGVDYAYASTTRNLDVAIGYSKGLGSIVWEIEVNSPTLNFQPSAPLCAPCGRETGAVVLGVLTVGGLAGGHDRQWCRRCHRVTICPREGDRVAAPFVPRGDRDALQAHHAAWRHSYDSLQDELESQLLHAGEARVAPQGPLPFPHRHPRQGRVSRHR